MRALLLLTVLVAPAGAVPLIEGLAEVGGGLEGDAGRGALGVRASLLRGRLSLGGELLGSLEGDSSGGRGCHPVSGDVGPSIYRECLHLAAVTHGLVGLRFRPLGLVADLDLGAGPARVWAVDGHGTKSAWALSTQAGAALAISVGEAMGGRWTLGLAVRAQSLDLDGYALSGGLRLGAEVFH